MHTCSRFVLSPFPGFNHLFSHPCCHFNAVCSCLYSCSISSSVLIVLIATLAFAFPIFCRPHFPSQANQIANSGGFAPNPAMFSQGAGGYPTPQHGGPPAPSPNQPYGMYPQPGGGMPQNPAMGYPGGPAPGQQMPGYPNAPSPNPSMPSYPTNPSPNPSMPAYGGGYGGGPPAVPAINVSCLFHYVILAFLHLY